MSASMVYYVVSGMSYIPPSAERRREWMIVDAGRGMSSGKLSGKGGQCLRV